MEVNIQTNFLISYNTCWDSATKISESFIDQKPQWQISLSNFKNDELKNLFIAKLPKPHFKGHIKKILRPMIGFKMN